MALKMKMITRIMLPNYGKRSTCFSKSIRFSESRFNWAYRYCMSSLYYDVNNYHKPRRFWSVSMSRVSPIAPQHGNIENICSG